MSDLYWQPPFNAERAERIVVPSWKPLVVESVPGIGVVVGKQEVWDCEWAHEIAFPEAETAEGDQRDFYRRVFQRLGR